MALFDSFKTVAQNAVEGALGIQRPQKDSQPADFKAPASSSSQAFDKPIQLPVMPWRKERDVSQAPVKSGTQASVEISAPPADTMPNTYAASETQRAPDILQLADAQSAAMMQETQDAINADNSGDEQVVEMMSGTPTQQIVAAKTPVELGLSKATGNLPPVPVNDVPTGPSPAFTKETVRQEQARMQAANAPASANIAQSGAASATGLFNKYRNLNRPNTSYVNEARKRANDYVTQLQEMTMRWAAASSGRNYTKGMSMGDIPAAALVLAMRDIPTPAYVTEAQKYYQSAVAQYGSDIQLIKAAAEQDGKLQAAIDTAAKYNNELRMRRTAARTTGLSVEQYLEGESAVDFGADAIRFASMADKDTRTAMNAYYDNTMKRLKPFMDKVDAGEDVSALTSGVAQGLYADIVSGNLDANTGASLLLGYLGRDNTRSRDDKALAAKLERRGYNDQAINTALAIRCIPQLKQNFLELEFLNRQADGVGVKRMAGNALNTVFASRDVSDILGLMDELDMAKRQEAILDVELNKTPLSRIRMASRWLKGNLGSAKENRELVHTLDDVNLVKDPTVLMETVDGFREECEKSPRPELRVMGSALQDGLGSSKASDRLQLLQDPQAIGRLRLTGLTGMAFDGAVNSYATFSGKYDRIQARDAVQNVLERYRGKPIGETVEALQQTALLKGLSSNVLEQYVMTAEDQARNRSSTARADALLDQFEMNALNMSVTKPLSFTVQPNELDAMREYANAYGLAFDEEAIKEDSLGGLSVEMTPMRAVMYDMAARIVPTISDALGTGRVLSADDIITYIAQTPNDLVAVETLCGPRFHTMVDNLIRNMANKYETKIRAQDHAVAQAQRTAQASQGTRR